MLRGDILAAQLIVVSMNCVFDRRIAAAQSWSSQPNCT